MNILIPHQIQNMQKITGKNMQTFSKENSKKKELYWKLEVMMDFY